MKNKTLFLISGIIAFYLISSLTGFSQNKKKTDDPNDIRNPVINYAEWTGSDEKTLYKNCITALHLAGLDIDPVKTSYGKEFGQILSDSIKHKIPADFRTSYKLSILVFKLNENKLGIHLIVNNPKIQIGKYYVGKLTINGFHNYIAEDVDRFILLLENMQGKASTTSTTSDILIQYNGLQ